MTTARRYDFATICAATNEAARHRRPGESARATVNRVLFAHAEQLRLLAELELERRDRYAEPAPKRSSRPAYVTGSRGRAAGPKAAAVRVTPAASRPGFLFAELEPAGPDAAYVETLDASGAIIGHRSGPLPLEAARRLAERRAHYLGLELEAATA